MNQTDHELVLEQDLSVVTENDFSFEQEPYQENLEQEQRIAEVENQSSPKSFPDGFFVDSGILYHQSSKKSNILEAQKEEDSECRTAVCSAIEVIADVRDLSRQDYQKLVRFQDKEGTRREILLKMTHLGGDARITRSQLLAQGLPWISTANAARSLLSNFLMLSKPNKVLKAISQPGWHEGAFLLSSQETIGSAQSQDFIFQNNCFDLPDYSASGTLEEWQTYICRYAIGNFPLVFSISASFLPPFLRLLDKESGGIHFEGPSSSGKTTLLEIANATWGPKERLQNWRMTINGLEGVAVQFNDALLCLDEIGQAHEDELGNAAYLLANEGGKGRATNLGSPQKRTKWKLFFMSNGEKSLAQVMNSVDKKTCVGQEIRLLDIPISRSFGVFDELYEFENGEQFSNHFKKAARLYNGTPIRHALLYLVEHQEWSLEFVNKVKQDFLNQYRALSYSGQIRRVLEKFALIAAVGEWTCAINITNWAKKEAFDAAHKAFSTWLASWGTIENKEEMQILSQVRNFFQLHGSSRFEDWGQNVKSINNRAGFTRTFENGKKRFYVFPEVYKNEICKGFSSAQVTRACKKHELIIADNNNKRSTTSRAPNECKATRKIVFASETLFGDDLEV